MNFLMKGKMIIPLLAMIFICPGIFSSQAEEKISTFGKYLPSYVELPVLQEEVEIPGEEGMSLLLVAGIALLLVILVLIFSNFLRKKP